MTAQEAGRRNPEESAIARRARLEFSFVVATGVVHLFFEEVLHAKAALIIASVIAWGAYIIHRIRSHPAVLAEWGFCRARSQASSREHRRCRCGGRVPGQRQRPNHDW